MRISKRGPTVFVRTALCLLITGLVAAGFAAGCGEPPVDAIASDGAPASSSGGSARSDSSGDSTGDSSGATSGSSSSSSSGSSSASSSSSGTSSGGFGSSSTSSSGCHQGCPGACPCGGTSASSSSGGYAEIFVPCAQSMCLYPENTCCEVAPKSDGGDAGTRYYCASGPDTCPPGSTILWCNAGTCIEVSDAGRDSGGDASMDSPRFDEAGE